MQLSFDSIILKEREYFPCLGRVYFDLIMCHNSSLSVFVIRSSFILYKLMKGLKFGSRDIETSVRGYSLRGVYLTFYKV